MNGQPLHPIISWGIICLYALALAVAIVGSI